MIATGPRVIAVGRSGEHAFSKPTVAQIELVVEHGVAGDAHAGITVQHRSRVAIDPTQPNLRQIHLIHAELLDELADKGFAVGPGDLGENVTTRGLDLLALPRGARLAIGDAAVVEVTGLRNPCAQIEAFRPGLLAHVVERSVDGTIVRKCGVMGVVVAGGTVEQGDSIGVQFPPPPHALLEPV